MTAVYFDANNDAHVALLPAQLRDDVELAALVELAEQKIIDHYTISWNEQAVYATIGQQSVWPTYSTIPAAAVSVGEGLWVCLRGYHATDVAQAGPLFAAAMRRAIAAVVRWSHAQWNKGALLASEGKENGSSTYRDDAEMSLPPGFDALLSNFDVRPVLDVM